SAAALCSRKGSPPACISPPSLHVDLPIFAFSASVGWPLVAANFANLLIVVRHLLQQSLCVLNACHHAGHGAGRKAIAGGGDERRSEEHTSELQSRENLVCRLLLEKKKINE